MKRSVKIRVISLIVAAIVLGGAVTAAAIMGSPYETLKRALMDAMTERNVTSEGVMTMTVNGVVAEFSKSHSIQADNGSLSYTFDDDGNIIGFYYNTNGLNVNPLGYSLFDDCERWYTARVYPKNPNYYAGGGNFAVFNAEDRNSAEMRFYELLLDLVVGDLKNNITMYSENGIRHISGTLTGHQVPEIVKAGIDLLVEQSSGYYYGGQRDVSFDGREYVFEHSYIDRGVKTVTTWRQLVLPMSLEEIEAWDNGTIYELLDNEGKEFWGFTYIDGAPWFTDGPQEVINEYTAPAAQEDYYRDYTPYDDDVFSIPMQSFEINYVRGEADVDSAGNLLNLNVSGAATVTDIFGKVSTVEIKANVKFSDFGISEVACPIPGAELLLTTEYVKSRFGSENINVYFRLNEDGTINADSITTTYPGELAVRFSTDAASYEIVDSSVFPVQVTTDTHEPVQSPYPVEIIEDDED